MYENDSKIVYTNQSILDRTDESNQEYCIFLGMTLLLNASKSFLHELIVFCTHYYFSLKVDKVL